MVQAATGAQAVVVLMATPAMADGAVTAARAVMVAMAAQAELAVAVFKQQMLPYMAVNWLSAVVKAVMVALVAQEEPVAQEDKADIVMSMAKAAVMAVQAVMAATVAQVVMVVMAEMVF